MLKIELQLTMTWLLVLSILPLTCGELSLEDKANNNNLRDNLVITTTRVANNNKDMAKWVTQLMETLLSETMLIHTVPKEDTQDNNQLKTHTDKIHMVKTLTDKTLMDKTLMVTKVAKEDMATKVDMVTKVDTTHTEEVTNFKNASTI
jgi:hypothetical protein